MSCNRLVSLRAPSLVAIMTKIFRVPCWQKVRNRLKKLRESVQHKIHFKKRHFNLKSVYLCCTVESSCSTRKLKLRKNIFQPVLWLEYELDYRGIGFRLSALRFFCCPLRPDRLDGWHKTLNSEQQELSSRSPPTWDQATSPLSSPLTFT
jgi:hypothetical protein